MRDKENRNRQMEISECLTDLNNKISYLYQPQMEAVFPGLSLSEVQSIELIPAIDNPNVTKLSEALYVTRGATSKVTKKLLKKSLIETYQLPTNKKEIYFRLTTEGETVNQRHKQLHEAFLENDKSVFKNLTLAKSQVILDFLKDYNRHLDYQLRKKNFLN